MKINLSPEETLEEINGGLMIIQNKNLYRFSEDSLHLADFVDMKPGSKVLDLGTGSGIILFLLYARDPYIRGTGVEIQSSLVEIARKSVAFNGLDDSIEIIQEDIRNLPGELEEEAWDVVTANPPYVPLDRGRKSPREEIAIARQEVSCCLEDVVRAASRMLKSGGSFALVYPVTRKVEAHHILKCYNLEPIRMEFVTSREDAHPYLLLLQAYKDAPRS